MSGPYSIKCFNNKAFHRFLHNYFAINIWSTMETSIYSFPIQCEFKKLSDPHSINYLLTKSSIAFYTITFLSRYGVLAQSQYILFLHIVRVENCKTLNTVFKFKHTRMINMWLAGRFHAKSNSLDWPTLRILYPHAVGITCHKLYWCFDTWK